MFTRTLLFALTAACLLDAQAPAATDPNPTQALIAVLRSDAGLFEKARACQQLGERGDKNAIPALAPLLNDEHLNAYARSALEGIPDASAAEALRAAVPTLKGSQLAGVINSLGVLRDANSVPLLSPLAANPESGVAKEALLALGRIANEPALRLLRQTLANGAETLRPEAGAACLLAAERQLAEGHLQSAVSLYDAVRNARVPFPCRAAATRGAILARKSPSFLIEQLRSPERLIRNVALMTIREMPGEALASALNAELEQAAPELQTQLLLALVDCHNSQSLPAVKARANSPDGQVRKTALVVLGQIGGPAETGAFLETLHLNRSPEETAIALRHLGQLEGAEVDHQVLQALSTETNRDTRLQLIRLVETRGMTNATAELFHQAAAPDTKLRVAALAALSAVAGPAEVPALVAYTRSCADETVRETAAVAIANLCRKSAYPEAEAELVLAELNRATEPAQRSCWLSILTSLGCARALPALKADLNNTNDQVAANAIALLGRWPVPAPIEDLLTVAESSPNPARRARALEAAVRLATAAADEHQRPAEAVVEWLRRADLAAQTVKDRRLVLSGLGRLSSIESLRLLARHLADPALEAEAGIPIVTMAPALAKQGYALETSEVLEQLAATAKNADLRQKAAKAAAAIRNQGLVSPLFDGRSLAGWEGNTNVWRVRDGLIVGGSMAGNPRNEFLATTRSYTNFVLRLEYKLLGTSGFINSGVQFRSLRLKQPAYEMAGFQADIGAGHSGCLYDESRRNKFMARAADTDIKRLEKPNDWNRYEVRCSGARIQILLNGVQTVDYTETDPAIPLSGLIALQIHGNSKAEVSFRNLVVQRL